MCEQGWRKGTTTRKFVLQGGSKSVYIIQEEIQFNQPALNLGSFIQVIPHAIHHQESEEGRGHQQSHLGSTSRYTNHQVHSCWYDKSSFWPPWYLTPTTRGFKLLLVWLWSQLEVGIDFFHLQMVKCLKDLTYPNWRPCTLLVHTPYFPKGRRPVLCASYGDSPILHIHIGIFLWYTWMLKITFNTFWLHGSVQLAKVHQPFQDQIGGNTMEPLSYFLKPPWFPLWWQFIWSRVFELHPYIYLK